MLIHCEMAGRFMHWETGRLADEDDEAPTDTQYPMTVPGERSGVGFFVPDDDE